MRINFMKAGVLATLAALTACTSGQVGATVPGVPAPLQSNTLEFSVGTATIGLLSTGTYYTGTNVVATYRQPNGLSGVLVDSPVITGPAAWVVPAGDDTISPDGTGGYAPWGSGGDAGTHSLTSTPQNTTNPPQTPGTTFGQTGGVFAYGIAPVNSNNQGNSTNFATYAQPFFVTDPSVGGSPGDAFSYIGGFPAYSPGGAHPNIRDGFYPAGFNGYDQGFTALAIPPALGGYSLTLTIPSGPNTNTTVSKTANLSTTTPLGPTTITGFTRNPDSGATVTVTVPPGATEAVVNFVDRGPASGTAACHAGASAPFVYSVVVHGTGPQVATVPGNAGPIVNGTQEPAFCTGDRFRVFAVAANYPLYESGPPQSTSPTPTIAGANGQADISMAIRIAGVY